VTDDAALIPEQNSLRIQRVRPVLPREIAGIRCNEPVTKFALVWRARIAPGDDLDAGRIRCASNQGSAAFLRYFNHFLSLSCNSREE